MVAPKVAWYALTWEHYCVLRHSLVSWLVIKDRIYTRDKLKLCGKVSDHSCVLCSRGHESRNQLFFMYVFQDSFAELLATSSGAVHGVLSV
ncbi:unnamed protein product [Linum trigynum]|uniref:Reverse transcriptase zinc-binding domain-containing protein n=1 Tax=Linum trigynum TaxID=586398 RepID=A0AAV2FEZ9_9ROSI